MKSFYIGGDVAVLGEGEVWEHPIKVVQNELNFETDLLTKHYSPSNGFLREYVFSTIVEKYNGTNVVDDEERKDGKEGTIY